MKWYIGCSGFYYKEWKGVFYPEKLPQKKWFEFYTSQFNTLELNVTFYRFPKLSFLQHWYNISPTEFKFAVKVPRLITHYKKFSDSRSLLEDFYETTEQGLKDKLGVILFQLPPHFDYTTERLELILEYLKKDFTNAIEFRDKSWWNNKVFERLKKEKVTFTGISYPALPDDIITNSKTVYYRFHGIPKLYYSAYKEKELKSVADKISAEKTKKEAYIFFNNTAKGSAIKNASWLKKYIEK